jgi:hypothetical protein
MDDALVGLDEPGLIMLRSVLSLRSNVMGVLLYLFASPSLS